MRNIPPQFADHLDGEVTTICRCWKITCRDGEVLGFTEHDNELQVDGNIYQPMSGLDATVAEASIGLNADSVEVLGALTSHKLSSEDIRADKYDGAQVEVLVVNWSSTNEFLLENVYIVGEITEEDGLFKAELRTLESQLDQTKGEHFIRQCQADLGDARCKIDLSQIENKGQGTVVSFDGNVHLKVDGLGAFEPDWFGRGILTWISGNNSGVSIIVSKHFVEDQDISLELWKKMPAVINVGDTFSIVAGCDKSFTTCKSKFANALNFRGFPHLPGNDFALSYVSNSKNLDGGVLVQ